MVGADAENRSDFIKSISEIPVFSTDRYFPDATGHEKSLSVEFGRLTICEDMALHLFGTSLEKESFELWEHLSSGVVGFVLLVEADSSSWKNGDNLVKFLAERELSLVVAVDATARSLKKLGKPLKEAFATEELTLVRCRAKEKASVKKALIGLVDGLLESA